MTEAIVKSPPAEPQNQLHREKILAEWQKLWADGKNPYPDDKGTGGILQPPQKPSILGEYRFPLLPFDEAGRRSVICWILQQADVPDDEIRKMPPYKTIYDAAIFLDTTVAQAVLIRAVTEVLRPGKSGMFKEDFENVLNIIDPRLSLSGLAMTIDNLDAAEWEKVGKNMEDRQYDWQAVSRRFDVLDGRNSEEHELISHMFEKAAYIDLNKGFKSGATPFYSEHPLVSAVRNAALETFHREELERRNFPLSSLGLFDI